MSIHRSRSVVAAAALLAAVACMPATAADHVHAPGEACDACDAVPGECPVHGPQALIGGRGLSGAASFGAHVHATAIYERVRSAANPALDGISDLRLHAHLNLAWRPVDRVTVVLGVKAEEDEEAPGAAPTADDRWLEDHSAFVDVAYAAWNPGAGFEVYAGKFAVAMGLDYHAAPGLYGYETLEEYALLEKVGLGAAYAWGPERGLRQRVEAAAFMADPTFLSESVIHNRGHLHEADGGAGNTGMLDNFALRWAGRGLCGAHGLGAAVAVATQAPGVDGSEREWRGVATVDWLHHLAAGVELRLLAEHAQVRHAEGQAGVDGAISTGGAELRLAAGPGAVILGGTWNWLAGDDSAPGAGDGDSGSSWQAAVGYQLGAGPLRGLRLDLGCKSVNGLGDEDLDKVGVGLTYHRAF